MFIKLKTLGLLPQHNDLPVYGHHWSLGEGVGYGYGYGFGDIDGAGEGPNWEGWNDGTGRGDGDGDYGKPIADEGEGQGASSVPVNARLIIPIEFHEDVEMLVLQQFVILTYGGGG